MQVDPDSRLVADALEADWNNSLRALEMAREEYCDAEQGRGLRFIDLLSGVRVG